MLCGGGFLGILTHTIEFDGIKELFAPTWNDWNASGIALGTAASAPDPVLVSGGTIDVRCFDGNATTEQLFWGFELSHEWKEDGDIIPHVHWMPSTANPGSVIWNMDYWVTEDGSATSTGTLFSTSTSLGVAWKEQRADFATTSLSGYDIGTQVMVRFYRVPSATGDDYPDDACLATVGMHYQQDSMGSSLVWTK